MRGMRFIWICLLVCAGFLCAQPPVRCPASGRLSEDQLADLIRSHVPEPRVEMYVKTCGISFQATEDATSRLRAAGAPAALISLLEKTEEAKRLQRLKALPNLLAIDEFTVNPRSIVEGAEVELRWRVRNADSVELQPGIGTVSADGSQKVKPTSTTTYRLAASGAGGPKLADVTVEVAKRARIVKFEANPTKIQAGGETTLSWQIENADSVEITGGVGQVSASGSRTVKPLSSGNYTATARRLGAEVKGTAVVQVIGPALEGGSRIEFARIPAGEFQMGSENGDPDEKPVHRVRITKAFEIGRFEVTQAQWGKVMGGSPSYFKGPDKPMESLSWEDVQGFLRKLNAANDGYHYRLPTEAEWEYAARAGSTADGTDLDSIAWHQGNANNETHVVGTKRANAWGLYDTIGNVWELCQDWYDANYYRNSPEADPPGPASGQTRVVRGGAWFGPPNSLRASYRERLAPADWGFRVGFRLVREGGASDVLGSVPSVGAKVVGLKFYENGSGYTAVKDRKYLTRFRSSETRYLNWEIELSYPLRTDADSFTMEAVWYGPDGSVLTRQSFDATLKAGWTGSLHTLGWGRNTTGAFKTGRYQIDVLVKEQVVARGVFEVY